MRAFDIGWIPEGWTKGEPLRVRNLVGPAVVALIDQDLKFDYGDPTVLNLTIATVPKGQEDRANEWLKWWRGS